MLLPNKRRLDAYLADSLRHQADGTVMVHPAAAVLSQWTEQLCVTLQLLLGEPVCRTATPALLQMLWQEAMPDAGGLSPEAEKRLAGKQARTADKWLRQWYPDSATPWLDGDFFKAQQAVQTRLREQKYLDADGWMAMLISVLKQTRDLPLNLPSELQLDGFHELTTLEESLFKALEQRGVKVQRCCSPGESPAANSGGHQQFPSIASDAGLEGKLTTSHLHAYPDATTELAAAAHWALQQVKAGKQRIAVVINGLENQLQRVRRSFANVFYPHHFWLDDGQSRNCLFHLPAGVPLLEQEVVQSALMLLQLSVAGPRHAIPFSFFSNWILNPYWGGADVERQARAQLEVHLRREGVFQVLPASLRERAAKAELAEGLSLAIAHSRQALKPNWNREDGLYHCLVAWGWPGPLVRGQLQQSAVQQLVLHIENLRGLGLESPGQALAVLRQMCADSRVTGEGGPLSPVQILSPEDAAGREFDAAWVANMHEGNWPGTPLRNPYLPADVARFIPRASHAGELAFTQFISQALHQLAPGVVFSWGRQSGDLELGPSPLVSDLELVECDTAPSADLFQQSLSVFSNCETATAQAVSWQHYGEHPWLKVRKDDRGLPLRAADEQLPAEAIRGGAAAINDQSALPLLGYLKHRLNARFDPMPDPFADAALRGSLLHAALQGLYQPCVGTAKLPDAWAIPAAVESALRERNAVQRLSALQYEAERLRLIRVLEEWLERDSPRRYQQIFALEQELTTELCGHPIRIRADRIDLLGDGSMLIMDYKSSKRDSSAWARLRLGEAQVPLYARLLQAEQPVGGVALATVRHGECQLDGVVQDAAYGFDKLAPLAGKSRNLDKRFTDWSEAMASWQQSIDTLAVEIIRGECTNIVYDPKHPGLDDFSLLLRHSEGRAWLEQQDSSRGDDGRPAAPMGVSK